MTSEPLLPEYLHKDELQYELAARGILTEWLNVAALRSLLRTSQDVENCTKLENTLVGPYGEAYPTTHDANQAMDVKAEAVSDAEEEEDPVPITFPEIKAEPEVSCMCTVRQMTQVCLSCL
ncbi:uncharacterized protein LOC111864806 [Cryptotermes secundus]|uniref:uncharacterized protein LOC111864806 n=1 Tax=Cryptotermes secundus TaxID=105785 RepID=UPI001454D17A|nr:uncharacterized protein LOC111864806 [Cryptotermes secundus]